MLSSLTCLSVPTSLDVLAVTDLGQTGLDAFNEGELMSTTFESEFERPFFQM